MAFPDNFKPDEGGAKGNYILSNLKSGETVKFRIMSEFITGQSVWGNDKDGKRVCTRVRPNEVMPVSAIGTNNFTGDPERVKQFIAAIAWNYETKQLEIFETDKATIIEPMFELEMTEEYGDLRGYDVKIAKNGVKTDTTYSVIALPPKKVSKEILEAYNESKIDLNKLYSNENPFQSEEVDTEAVAEDVAKDAPF